MLAALSGAVAIAALLDHLAGAPDPSVDPLDPNNECDSCFYQEPPPQDRACHELNHCHPASRAWPRLGLWIGAPFSVGFLALALRPGQRD